MASGNATATTAFSDFALAPSVLLAVGKVGYEQPSPVQRASIEPLLAGNDLLATAQTGTGKTAAFALPLLSKLALDAPAPQVLVLAPTRELAIQVAEAFDTYASEMRGFRALAIYGGQSMSAQLQQLRRGVHVVVGTPGRVMDHLRRKSLKLDQLQAVVLDEADEMLRMGFIDDVQWILEHTPAQKQVALFSATMPKPIRKIAENYLRNAVEVSIEADTQAISSIEQYYWPINRTRKIDALTRLLEAEPVDAAVIFVRTKSQTVEVADRLALQGFNAAEINGDMNQQLRERTIAKLKEGQIDILVATDVAARGIDVARVSHVFNYDMPFDSDVYTHRIGRTGRAGRSGKAILFVSQREKRLLRSLERATNNEIELIELPTPAQIRKLRINQFKEKILAIDTTELPELFGNITREIIEQSGKPAEELATALLYLAQQQKPFYTDRKKRDETESSSDEKHSPTHDNRLKSRAGEKQANKRRPRQAKAIIDEQGEEVSMETFRIHVGYQDEVSPADIVGAIANEAEISSQYIGRINIENEYSTVDLPEGMPKDVFMHLKKVRIKKRRLEIERLAEKDDSAGKRRQRSADSGKSKKGSKGTDRKKAGANKRKKKSQAKKLTAATTKR